jgi:hypothetical protein
MRVPPGSGKMSPIDRRKGNALQAGLIACVVRLIGAGSIAGLRSDAAVDFARRWRPLVFGCNADAVTETGAA